jgi:hypothetical protein
MVQWHFLMAEIALFIGSFLVAQMHFSHLNIVEDMFFKILANP